MTNTRKSLGHGVYLELLVEGKWEFVHRIKGIGACAILATTRLQEMVLVEQYRPAVQKNVIDLPAGLVGDESEDDTDFVQTAHRELLEETGYEARTMKYLQAGPTSAGALTEIVHFYRAKNVKKVAEGGGVDDENIIVHVIPLQKVMSWFKSQVRLQKLIDSKAWFAAAMLAAEQSHQRDSQSKT